MISTYLSEAVSSAAREAGFPEPGAVALETPRDPRHGDLATNVAMQLAVASPSRALTVSVDLRNEPALRLYLHHDFLEFDRQDVFLASWPGSS